MSCALTLRARSCGGRPYCVRVLSHIGLSERFRSDCFRSRRHWGSRFSCHEFFAMNDATQENPAPVEPPLSTSVAPSPQGQPPSTRSLFVKVFPSIMLPMFLAVADQTIVATALPAIASGLGEIERASWVVVSYLIANTIAAPVYGRLGDTFDRRGMMIFALAIFVLGSVLCALSPNIEFLTAA